jgi:hypothetical protein
MTPTGVYTAHSTRMRWRSSRHDTDSGGQNSGRRGTRQMREPHLSKGKLLEAVFLGKIEFINLGERFSRFLLIATRQMLG